MWSLLYEYVCSYFQNVLPKEFNSKEEELEFMSFILFFIYQKHLNDVFLLLLAAFV